MKFKSYSRIIEEGGAYGHMANVHEDYNLRFEDLSIMINTLLSGGIKGEMKEKTDGQALAVSFRAGRVIFARNKGHYKGFGVKSIKGSKGIAEFFDEHPNKNIRESFKFAAKDLEKAILALSKKQLARLFGDGKRWVNIEVIWPKTVNVIPYFHKLIVLHNFREYDIEGNVVDGDFDEAGRMMSGMIKQVNQNVQDKFTIQSMPLLKMPKISNFEKNRDKYISTVNNLMTSHDLDPGNTIGDYWVSYMSGTLANAAKQFNYIIQPDVMRGLAVRWAYKSLPPGRRPSEYSSIAIQKISDLKTRIDNDQFLSWVHAFERAGELKELLRGMNEPLKTVFLQVGVEVNKNMSNLLTMNPSEAAAEIRHEIDKVTAEIEKTGDLSLMDKLKTELKTIQKLGGLEEMIPSEGLTFTYTPKGESVPKIFKLTAWFAPVNQILGSLKFSR